MRPKHGKMSCGDCRVSRQDFRTLKKLTDRWNEMGPTGRVSGCEWPIGRGRLEALYVVSELVIHLGSGPRGVLRPVVGHNEGVTFFEKG